MPAANRCVRRWRNFPASSLPQLSTDLRHLAVEWDVRSAQRQRLQRRFDSKTRLLFLSYFSLNSVRMLLRSVHLFLKGNYIRRGSNKHHQFKREAPKRTGNASLRRYEPDQVRRVLLSSPSERPERLRKSIDALIVKTHYTWGDFWGRVVLALRLPSLDPGRRVFRTSFCSFEN